MHMVVRHTLSVSILLSCIKPMIFRHITQGYKEAIILAQYQTKSYTVEPL